MKIKPEMKKDYETGVLNNQDSYGKAIYDYANRWAELMEKEIEKGGDPEEVLNNVAEKTSFDADTDGITGFMYGSAVALIADCWIFGEILRKWHNKQYGHDGDGVVNPAILTIGVV